MFDAKRLTGCVMCIVSSELWTKVSTSVSKTSLVCITGDLAECKIE